MNSQRNFFQRAVDAVIEGRTRQAQRFINQYERDHARTSNKVNSR